MVNRCLECGKERERDDATVGVKCNVKILPTGLHTSRELRTQALLLTKITNLQKTRTANSRPRRYHFAANDDRTGQIHLRYPRFQPLSKGTGTCMHDYPNGWLLNLNEAKSCKIPTLSASL